MKNAPHIGYTKKQWRVHKRRQARELWKAINNYAFGSAYCPGYEELFMIQSKCTTLMQKLSAKNWGH